MFQGFSRHPQEVYPHILVLVTPMDNETLLLYIAANAGGQHNHSGQKEKEEGHALLVQCLVYFISLMLIEIKTQ